MSKEKKGLRGMMKNINGTRKHFRVGMYTTVVSLAAILLTVLVNLFVGSLPDTKTKYDLSAAELFTIGEQSVQIAKSIDHEVTIYLLAQNGNEEDALLEFLNRYSAQNSKIKVKTKDPVLYSTFASQYTSEEVTENSLIVVDDVTGRSVYIDYDDIYYISDYSIDYTTYSYVYEYGFDGESLVTSALNYVSSEDLPVVYRLSGHGELPTDYFDVETMLAGDNVTLDSLNLLTTGSIPEDCDCLLIFHPTSDLSSSETEIVLTYLKEGGKAMIVTDPSSYSAQEYPNLASVLAYYGITTEEGVVVEGDGNYYYRDYYSYPSYLLPDINASHEITAPLAGNYYVLLPTVAGITVTDTGRDTVTVTSLLDTSDSAYSKAAGYNMTTYTKEDGDIDGGFSVAVAVTETLGEGSSADGDTDSTTDSDADSAIASDTDSMTASDTDSDEADDANSGAASDTQGDSSDNETRIVYFTGYLFLYDQIDSQVSGANHDLFLNSVGWLCDRSETISIRAKTYTDEYITVSSGAAVGWEILLIAVLPLAVLIPGIVICVRRRTRV